MLSYGNSNNFRVPSVFPTSDLLIIQIERLYNFARVPSTNVYFRFEINQNERSVDLCKNIKIVKCLR